MQGGGNGISGQRQLVMAVLLTCLHACHPKGPSSEGAAEDAAQVVSASAGDAESAGFRPRGPFFPPPRPLPPPKFPSIEHSFKATRALVRSGALVDAVEALAKMHTVTSREVGRVSDPSPAWVKAQRVFSLADVDELTALLSHTSGVVRMYVSDHIAERYPERGAALYSLLADTTVVPTMNGCISFQESVGTRVAGVLPDVEALVAAQDARLSTEIRKSVFRRLTRSKIDGVRNVAYSALVNEPTLRSSAIFVLRHMSHADLQTDVPYILLHTADSDAEVRLSVAGALQGLTGQDVNGARRALASDVDARVRRAVATSLTEALDDDVAVVGPQLAKDADTDVRTELALVVWGKGPAFSATRGILVRDTDVGVRTQVAYTLRRIAPDDDGLRRLLASDPDEAVRDAAADEAVTSAKIRERWNGAYPDAGRAVATPQMVRANQAGCSPPFTVDRAGVMRYKPECIK